MFFTVGTILTKPACMHACLSEAMATLSYLCLLNLGRLQLHSSISDPMRDIMTLDHWHPAMPMQTRTRETDKQ